MTVSLAVSDSLGVKIALLGGAALIGVAVFVGAAWLFAREELSETWETVRSGVGDILKRKGRASRGA